MNQELTTTRHEFSAKVKATLAKRVGFKCSNPNCNRTTSGPSTEKDKSINIGVAAHIIPASVNGPRAEKLTSEKRKGISNGIWLCQSCSVLIDKDPIKFDKSLLYVWKHKAEKIAEKEIDSSLKDDYFFYNDIFFRSKSHAIWAAFFDEINWHYSYENDNDILRPNFLLKTHGGDNFEVYILSKKEFSLSYRQQLGKAKNYPDNILITDENPFPKHDFNYCNNVIGMSSLEGMIESSHSKEDIEFCTAVVSSSLPLSVGTNIYNLCKLDPMFHEIIVKENAFCIGLWKKAKLIIG